MIKAILLFLAVAVATSFMVKTDKCPHDLEVLCIDDINKGSSGVTQLMKFVIRLLRRREGTFLLTLSA